MLNLLGIFSKLSENIWKIVVIIVVALIFILCLKYKNGRIFIFTFLIVAFIAFTAYCGVQLNFYYSSSGGIYGQLVSIYNPNEVVITDNVSYSFKNLVLTQEEGDIYSAKITSDEVLDMVLDENAVYGVYINGLPCNYVEITEDYVIAKYTYTFLDENLNELKTDTLTLRFAFYTNSTYLSVTTSGGSEAVKYWNYYFNKNVFEVTIDNKGYSYSSDISFGNGDISEYVIISYYIDDELYLKQVYKKGSTINLPTTQDDRVYCWKLNNEIVTDDYIIKDTALLHQSLKDEINIDRYLVINLDNNGSIVDDLSFDLKVNNNEIKNLNYYQEEVAYEYNIELYNISYEGFKSFDGTKMTKYVLDGIKALNCECEFDNDIYYLTNFENGSNITFIIKAIEETTYNVIYNGNGATSGTTSNSLHTYGQNKGLNYCGYEKLGYVFLGWSLTPDGKEQYYDGIMTKDLYNLNNLSTNDIVLYAIWGKSEEYISYNVTAFVQNTSGSYASNKIVSLYGKLNTEISVYDISNILNIEVEGGIEFSHAIISGAENNVETIMLSDNSNLTLNMYYDRLKHNLIIHSNGNVVFDESLSVSDDGETATIEGLYYLKVFNINPSLFTLKEGVVKYSIVDAKGNIYQLDSDNNCIVTIGAQDLHVYIKEVL